jgi:hypothetical protein
MDKQDIKDLVAILANITKVLSDIDTRLRAIETEREKNAIEKRVQQKSHE